MIDIFLQYSWFVLLFYIIAFLVFVIKACWHLFTIISLKNEAFSILEKLSGVNPPTENVEHGVLTFQSNMAWQNSTPELKTIQLKYERWCYKLGRIKTNSYASWAQNFKSMSDNLFDFINLSSEYCWDELGQVFKNTFLAPSKILKYVGIPINFISRVLDILLGFAGLLPIINKIGQFIPELLQKISQ